MKNHKEHLKKEFESLQRAYCKLETIVIQFGSDHDETPSYQAMEDMLKVLRSQIVILLEELGVSNGNQGDFCCRKR